MQQFGDKYNANVQRSSSLSIKMSRLGSNWGTYSCLRAQKAAESFCKGSFHCFYDAQPQLASGAWEGSDHIFVLLFPWLRNCLLQNLLGNDELIKSPYLVRSYSIKIARKHLENPRGFWFLHSFRFLNS